LGLKRSEGVGVATVGQWSFNRPLHWLRPTPTTHGDYPQLEQAPPEEGEADGYVVVDRPPNDWHPDKANMASKINSARRVLISRFLSMKVHPGEVARIKERENVRREITFVD